MITYPATLKVVEGVTYKDVTVQNQDELIELIIEHQKASDSEKKKISQILDECGVSGMNVIDDRTVQLFELWNYYRYAPHLIDSEPFYDAVQTFNLGFGYG